MGDSTDISHTPVRFVTAASLFDGHDAAINIIRRILQARGAEVIHLGHNRSVQAVVHTAIEEDADGIAVSSYQGGHMDYFKYMIDLLAQNEAEHIQVFAGGGGVIVPAEIEQLEALGVAKVFSPADGFEMGLQGMVDHMMELCARTAQGRRAPPGALMEFDRRRLALALTGTQSETAAALEFKSLPDLSTSTGADDEIITPRSGPVVLGFTGTGGAGKSTLIDEFIRRYLTDFPDHRAAVLSVDPSRARSGGALLADRIRMNTLYGTFANRTYMHSFATRGAHPSITHGLDEAVRICRSVGFDLIVLETAGIGQSDTSIVELSDLSTYVMTQEYGAPTQLEKIAMLDVADFVVLNKFEQRGSEDALRYVRKQVQRNQHAFDQPADTMPVYPTMASQFNDAGVTNFYLAVLKRLTRQRNVDYVSRTFGTTPLPFHPSETAILPPARQRYLVEIVTSCRNYRHHTEEQVAYARRWEHARGALEQLENWSNEETDETKQQLETMRDHWWQMLDDRSQEILERWNDRKARYRADSFTYTVRGKEVTVPLYRESLSGLKIPRVIVPRSESPAEQLRFSLLENLPGYFPFTAGVYPFKRSDEDPTRMFAGEGSPERTNKRFHLISEGMEAKRLSTAFDSVTLYGRDPNDRPDIYGKVGNAGVSIATLDDMKKLYSGFDLCDSKTSVSMTINGPAPMILAMFMNTAIDQQIEQYLKADGRWPDVQKAIEGRLDARRPRYIPYEADTLPPTHDGFGLDMLGVTGSDLVQWNLLAEEEYTRITNDTLHRVRGTVQADILKEDQAQNTCIFSTEFALRMMGDVQEYFAEHEIRNFYSISISGYHIAEAGANPITQLAFTLANGFTYVEYFLSRGLDIDDFAPNLSFFFSNGMDPEYNVIGRVARRIWAVTMREKYGADARSQKLKYHIQTSGRSLHAREIQFNDIRTTLQALMAIYDNCNSLHTNAYDEAITTPTEESVRRAIAIQLIINKEFGLAKNENPLQGSHIIEELTDLVEEAVLYEFERLNQRGGVLGAMEHMYQRGKIQDESLKYEEKKHSGELPIVGVNMFTDSNNQDHSPQQVELMRSSDQEKQQQIDSLQRFRERHTDTADEHLSQLQKAARNGHNMFNELMKTVKYCSLGQITDALFEVGGEYRRNV